MYDTLLKQNTCNGWGDDNFILPAGGEEKEKQYARLTYFLTTKRTMEILYKIVFLSVIAR